MKHLLLTTACAVALSSALSVAGESTTVPVEIDLDNRFAMGDMMTARWSKDNGVFIGCGLRHLDDGAGGAFVFGFCQAQDMDGNTAFCATSNTAVLDAMDAIASNSFISFFWDESETCTRIGISTQSWYLNKNNPSFTKP